MIFFLLDHGLVITHRHKTGAIRVNMKVFNCGGRGAQF